MDDALFKYIAPAVLLLLWGWFAYTRKDPNVRIATLYLTSTAAFGSNWEFIFREMHQAIHLAVAILGTVALGRRVPRFNLGLLAFLGFIALSLMEPGLADSASAVVNFVLIALVVNYFYARCWTPDRMGAFLAFWALSATAAALLAVPEYLLLEHRVEGSFNNPNYFGYFIGIGYVASFYAFKSRWRVVFLTAILLAIVLSGSRAAAAFPVLHTVHYLWTSRHWGYKLLVAGAAFVFAAFLVMTGTSRFSDEAALSGSDAERRAIIQVALSMGDDHPLTGVGWGRFPDEFAEYAWASEIVYLDHGAVDVTREDRRVTHNDFLRILAELGYGAALLAAVALASAAWRFWRGKTAWPVVFLPLWYGSLAFSMTHNNMNAALFWLIFLVPFYGAFQSTGKARAPAAPLLVPGT